jgi:hypothetical protein
MTEKKPKEDPMDIEVLIDKVSKLPISDIQKADLLRKFKENMMNPDRGEIENLNRIQSKYSSMYPMSPTEFLPPVTVNPYFNQNPMAMQGMMMAQPQQQGLTVAHFDILKNKMDSIQLELVDLLRHVKDYTMRYMNATRQQDMEKIDAYINGLFEVDKKMKRAEEQAAMMAVEEEVEAAAATPSANPITRATEGIKGFLGSIGDGMSGITNFVSNTANIVNNTLSKKVLGGKTPAEGEQAPGESTNTTTTNTANAEKATTAEKTANATKTQSPQQQQQQQKPNSSKNTNVVSIDEYIQSNMNQMESPNSAISNAASPNNQNVISVNSNNINSIAKPVQPSSVSAPSPASATEPAEKKPVQEESSEANQADIESAINRLNDTMNADIENTVSEGEKQLNTTSITLGNASGNTSNTTTSNMTGNAYPNKDSMIVSGAQPITQSGGGRGGEQHLARKIRMLKLKITKRKLEEQLLDKDKTKHHNKMHHDKMHKNQTHKNANLNNHAKIKNKQKQTKTKTKYNMRK